MVPERSGYATVIAQEGDRLKVEYRGQQLTVPMRGFPPGYRLRARGRVILVDEPSGPVARPLVRTVSARLPQETVDKRGTVVHEGRQLEMQESTVVEGQRSASEAQASSEHNVWIVESAPGEAADQVIATRRLR